MKNEAVKNLIEDFIAVVSLGFGKVQMSYGFNNYGKIRKLNTYVVRASRLLSARQAGRLHYGLATINSVRQAHFESRFSFELFGFLERRI